MALRLAIEGGQYWVTGVVDDPAVRSLLGQQSFQVGDHYIGFDQRFSEPVTVRAYFDAASSPDVARENAKYPKYRLNQIGYLQAMRVEYAGVPIPPDVFGGRLADRWPYATPDDRFLDFMGPKEAIDGRLLPYYPFYAYNGLLQDGTALRVEDFYAFGRPNGSLFSPRPVQGVDPSEQARCASITAEVATGLITAEEVSNALMAENLILTLTPTEAELGNFEPYQLALNELRTRPLPGAPNAPAPLATFTDDDAKKVRAQVIGRYVLLTLPDDSMPDTLCVYEEDGSVLVHLLTVYEMDEMWDQAGPAALWRISDYLDSIGRLRPPAPPPGRGRAKQPLRGEPPIAQEATNPVCKLRYWTFAMGTRLRPRGGARARVVLSGFTWAAVYQYDRDTDHLDFTAIEVPKAMGAFELDPLLAAYTDALNDPELRGGTIDLSNFTAAALRRDNFGQGAGNSVPFIDPATGMDIG
ncbi:hypothetical protein ACFO3J_17730 [Streptomyces polygonati]|uniref:Uncharacterized protein n=1 Tax=Streptomyces polygonati TaxID=1617087 RepID=A0ABV8HTX0_9ACTN